MAEQGGTVSHTIMYRRFVDMTWCGHRCLNGHRSDFAQWHYESIERTVDDAMVETILAIMTLYGRPSSNSHRVDFAQRHYESTKGCVGDAIMCRRPAMPIVC